MNFILILISTLMINHAWPIKRPIKKSLNIAPILKENILRIINDMSSEILKSYLRENNEAFARLGNKLDVLAEKMLDQEIMGVESEIRGINNTELKELIVKDQNLTAVSKAEDENKQGVSTEKFNEESRRSELNQKHEPDYVF